MDVRLVAPDLQITFIRTEGILQGGENIRIEWETYNSGDSNAYSITDSIYLSQDGYLGTQDILLGQIVHKQLSAQDRVVSHLNYILPNDLYGDWHLLIITDKEQKVNENNREQNNLGRKDIHVKMDAYADLTVSHIHAPERIIDDPAVVTVEWTVTNIGQGKGRTVAWTDSIIYSSNDILGDSDDLLLGRKVHTGALAVGEHYTDKITYRFAPEWTRSGRLFVQTDALDQVWENNQKDNNIKSQKMDVMPEPYSDLFIEQIYIIDQAVSGRSLKVSWSVINQGIGITNHDMFSEYVWLSENADGTGKHWKLGTNRHLGRLEAGSRYQADLSVMIPEGLNGQYYLNIAVDPDPYPDVFEFVHKNNNHRSISVPIHLAPSADLLVEQILLPEKAEEGDLIEVSWTVVNQGQENAIGGWQDELRLVSADGSQEAINLGRYSYTQIVAAGKRYTRTEQIRLPRRLGGLWHLEVSTNRENSVYEHQEAQRNNQLLSSGLMLVKLNSRPDLRVSEVKAPEKVNAGGRVGVKYTVSNMGSMPSKGSWQDSVYLSLDGQLSADDHLLKRINNPSALATGEQYTVTLEDIEIPIRYRGDVYLIIVADDAYAIDEYPNENNNIAIVKLYVEPVPFADLVTSDLGAPTQVVHGSMVEVNYKVSNRGSASTFAGDSSIDTWTDTLWLARDPRRPSVVKGDILLGEINHQGHLKIGEDYLGSIQARIPEEIESGQYYLTVWSDSYNVILEDTQSSYLNPDDPSDIDNNNYRAQAVRVLGTTLLLPDLVVNKIVAPTVAKAGEKYSFSYTVQNRAGAFEHARWADRVWLADDADLTQAKHRWLIGEFTQERGLGHHESYTIEQTVLLAPSVAGSRLIVETATSHAMKTIKESTQNNNLGVQNSQVENQPSDLQVISVTAQPTDSGEKTQISWVVKNTGSDIWQGSQSWQDAIYISKDPEFIFSRAELLGVFEHINTGLLSGAQYTQTAQVNVPAGYDGQYYIYVLCTRQKY